MRYILSILAVVVLTILAVILIVGHNSKTDNSNGGKTPATNVVLTDYINKSSSVIMQTNGQVNGDDAHRAIRITVSKNERRLDIIQGYQNTIISSQSFVNNTNAYDVFIHAINVAGFTKVRTGVTADE